MRQKQEKKRKKQRKHRRHSSDRSERSQSREERSRHHKSQHQYRQQSPRRKHKKRRRQDSSQQKDRRVHKHEHRQREQNVKIQNRQRQYDGWESSQQRNPEVRSKQQIINNQQADPNAGQAPKKQQPNFEPSGILLRFYNARQGIALKFHQPPQSHAPVEQWRIYPFKQNNPLQPIILNKSCYLIGKDERICDILCQNQSISRQHAVIQFRSQYTMKIDGTYQMEVKPYLLDLQSTNGTMLNQEKIESQRYYELLEKDILKFGLSQREYIMFKVPNKSSTSTKMRE